jgi:hypothetical protein
MCGCGLLHDALAALEVTPARLGQGEAPCGALKKANPDAFLHQRYAARQRGNGYARSLARAGETQGASDLHEKHHVLHIRGRQRLRGQNLIFSQME